MVRKKVKKSPARSKKKVSNRADVNAEFSVMEVGDLESLICSMISKALAPQDTPQQGEVAAPVNQAAAAANSYDGQTSGNESASSPPAKLLTLPEELQALHERMMAAFGPEMQAIEKRFGYAAFYRDLSLAYLSHAVRSMAAAVAERDPRGFSGKPVWWESRDDEIIANALYSRLASEMTSLRQLAKVRKPEAFDARQLIPCFSATNS